jgi:hypothetical protein
MSQMDKMGSMAKYTLTLTRRWSKDDIEKKHYSTQTWTWMTWTYILFNIFSILLIHVQLWPSRPTVFS